MPHPHLAGVSGKTFFTVFEIFTFFQLREKDVMEKNISPEL
jgi:hypothetical protein